MKRMALPAQAKKLVSSCNLTVVSPIVEHMEDKTYVDTGDLGKGLFARKPINKGVLIYRFIGDLIDFTEAASRGDKECYSLQIEKNTYIDIVAPGCYANHSCEPNAGIRNTVELVALTDIHPGVEIRFDYSTTMDEDYYT